jgi:hypothetical protein
MASPAALCRLDTSSQTDAAGVGFRLKRVNNDADGAHRRRSRPGREGEGGNVSECWTVHFWMRGQFGIIYCGRCGIWYSQPWTAVDVPCEPAAKAERGAK